MQDSGNWTLRWKKDRVALKRGLLTIQTLCFIVLSINATPAFTKWLLELLRILGLLRTCGQRQPGFLKCTDMSPCLPNNNIYTILLLYVLSGVAGVTDEG